jgi:hypothetical protein
MAKINKKIWLNNFLCIQLFLPPRSISRLCPKLGQRLPKVIWRVRIAMFTAIAMALVLMNVWSRIISVQALPAVTAPILAAVIFGRIIPPATASVFIVVMVLVIQHAVKAMILVRAIAVTGPIVIMTITGHITRAIVQM